MKNLKKEKVLGYVVLIVGLCIMGYSIASIIIVFNGGEVPLKLLHSENNETNTDNQTNQTLNLGEVIEPLFPMFNTLTWALIALLLVASGGRLARIGISIMKTSIPDEVKIIKDQKNYKKETEKIKTSKNKDEKDLKK